MPFDNPSKSVYSQSDWALMQAAYDKAAKTLVVKSSSDDSAKIIAETVMTAFDRGNKDINSLAALAVITAINAHPSINPVRSDQQQGSG
ncbi:MAG: hypothetical protein ACRECY_02470 [Phyllobacterium sp.]